MSWPANNEPGLLFSMHSCPTLHRKPARSPPPSLLIERRAQVGAPVVNEARGLNLSPPMKEVERKVKTLSGVDRIVPSIRPRSNVRCPPDWTSTG